MFLIVAEGGGEATPKAFGLDATVWVSIAMLAFLGILLWKKVPAMIAASLDSKIAGIRKQLDEAETLRNEAEALKAEYAAKIAGAEAEAAEMRARAEAEAALLVDKAKADTTALIARRKKMAEDRIGAAEAAALGAVRAAAARAATEAAATLIVAKHDAVADKGLVDSAIKALTKG
ncbi:MAG: F0F1 ATP synthase subunit B [Sphingopyxis sp.]|nr:F0F1 ATP synthase subunit B [Sphingopyxis sp.]